MKSILPDRRKESLRKRLIVMLGGTLVIILFIIYRTTFFLVTNTEKLSWQGRQTLAAKTAALNISSFLDSARGSLRFFINTLQTDNVDSHVDQLIQASPNFLEVMIVTADGQIQAKSSKTLSLLHTDAIADEPWFKQAQTQQTGQIALTELALSPNQTPFLIMSTKAPNASVVAVVVDMSILQTIVANSRFGETGQIYIASAKGSLIVHDDPQIMTSGVSLSGRPEMSNVKIPAAAQESATSSQPTYFDEHEYTNFQGVSVLGVVYAVPGTDWIIFSEVSWDEAFTTSRKNMIPLTIFVILFWGGAVVTTARLIDTRIFTALNRLQSAQKKISQGDLDTRIEINMWDEMGIVTEGFNTMVRDLQQRTLERQKAEATLHENEKRYRELVENVSDIVYSTDIYGYFTYMSPASVSVTGYRSEELIGKHFSTVIDTEWIKAVLDYYKDQLKGIKGETILAFPIVQKSGEKRWVEQKTSLIFDEDHKVIGFQSIVRDITERKEAEAQIQIQNQALVKANRDLAVARKQAEAASKLKSQFLATMSHELRTPLNAVIGYAQLQLAGIVGEMNEEQFGFQERILANAQHLLGLINEVLDLSKIEAGRMELVDRPFNLRECLNEIMMQNKVLAQDKALAFTLTVDDRLPAVIVGDRGRIKQVIINLVSNAIKFTDQGAVTVEAVLYNKDSWRITVTDTGAGIAPHLQETIFDEFRQAENGIERGGTGLGLAIVRKLVLMMGGNVRLTSEVGQGSAFSITLPLMTETQQMSEALEI